MLGVARHQCARPHPREGYNYYITWQHHCRRKIRVSNILICCLGNRLYFAFNLKIPFYSFFLSLELKSICFLDPPQYCCRLKISVSNRSMLVQETNKTTKKCKSSKAYHSPSLGTSTVVMKPFITLATLNHVYSNYFWHPTFTVNFYKALYLHPYTVHIFNTRNISISCGSGIQVGPSSTACLD